MLGIVTREEWDGHQGSWPDQGCLEPAPGSEPAIALLATECRLHDDAVRTELAGGDSSGLLVEAARVQAEFLRPGVVLVSVTSGSSLAVDEFHAEGERVYWR
ncbi:MAG: hypothetical protein JNM56_09020 [Planctomycetia bacterium]|nr:hypothetical protein [Planctomycetia bacterium]